MSDQQTSQERTEQPTEKRKEDSRKKGQVPRSKELNTMLSLVIGALALLMLGDTIAIEFTSLFESAFIFERELAYDKELLAVRLIGLITSSVLILTPFFAVMVVGAFAGPLLMGGFSFSVSAMAFKLEKLSPAKGIKRVFSAKGLAELLKTLFKFFALSGITIFMFNVLLDEILALASWAPEKAFIDSVTLLQWGLLVISSTMVLIVVFDVPFELWSHNKQLKMTLQEVKDEMKETDGRPEVKARIRALQREASQRRMMQAVPSADVVITNPTHFAVALKYDNNAGSAPVVLAKGRGLIALNIRSVATDNNVAIFSAPPLARALYSSAEIGEEIPQNLYLAVAKVLAYIYQISNAGEALSSSPPQDIPIPDEYRNLYSEGSTIGE
ncbi:MAG: flagellar biosynthetic protein FlhB [Halioglobus sp.]